MSEPAPSREYDAGSALSSELVRELLAARLVGVLATLRPDGAIDVVPMWYAEHEDRVVLATSSRSRKVRNLELEPHATLVLHDSRPGYEVCGASIAGTVEIVRAPEARALVDVVHARYLLAEADTDPAVAGYLASDDVALVFAPTTAVTWDERGSEAAEIVRARGWALPLEPTEPRP